MKLTRISYDSLKSSRARENFNFHQIAARLAEYGYHSIRLTDDWQGADFIAVHVEDGTILKVQLKARLSIDKRYLGKDLYIAFRDGMEIFLYDHDMLVGYVVQQARINTESLSWKRRGIWNWPTVPEWARNWLYTHDFHLRAGEGVE